jgi:hypothetical protein
LASRQSMSLPSIQILPSRSAIDIRFSSGCGCEVKRVQQV